MVIIRKNPPGLFVIVLLLSLLQSSYGFNPTLSVDSCTKSKLVLTLSDAENNGIVYIQGQGAACKQTTVNTPNVHEFDFGSCGITWESEFKIIVQKKALYQTGADKQIPIMCLADLSDIDVSNGINALDKDDDAGQNLTVKPTASMLIYSSNGNDVSGQNVQLTEDLVMTLQLDADFLQDFDIKAKTCTASTIPIIDNACATDIELFPHFTHTTNGVLTASFGAFRTTDLNGGSVSMTFSCTLQVCLGNCVPETCADGQDGWGRKKRDVSPFSDRNRRQAGQGFDDISVGATLRVAAEEVIIEDDGESAALCIDTMVFAVTAISLLFAAVALGVALVFVYKKKQTLKTRLQKYENTSTGMAALS